MHVRIFTLPFDGQIEGFPDELIAEFCRNKKVLRIETHFFREGGKPYWSVAVHYELVLAERDKSHDLDEAQKLLFQRLREWRKETATKEGLPAYLLATNAQLTQMVQQKSTTLESLKLIKGFGKQHIQKYGRDIVARIKQFYEEEALKAVETNQKLAKEQGDIPY